MTVILLLLIGCGGQGTPADKVQLSVRRTGEGAVTSMPVGIACGDSCQASFDPGVAVQLVANPAPQGWTGCDAQTATSCTVTLTASRTVAVAFGENPDPDPDPPPAPDACAFVISQNITVATRLTKTERECDYLIAPSGGASGLSIQNGPLVIDPGVVIRIARDVTVTFFRGGSLHAVGTPEAPIRIEGVQPIRGYAVGLKFLASDSATVNRLEHVQLAYLGRETSLSGGVGSYMGGALGGSAPITLRHVSVRGSNFHGLDLRSLDVRTFENNSFADNALHPLFVSARQVSLLDSASDYLGDAPNGIAAIKVQGLWADEELRQSATWGPLAVPYLMHSLTKVTAGTLTILPGTVLLFDSEASLSIRRDASLRAIGTSEAPIVFRGLEPRAGYWDGINFFESGSSSNHLEYVIVAHGGGESLSDNANIRLALNAYLYLANSLIAQSAGYGICITTNSLLEYENLQFEDNPWGDIVTDC
jgi:hypothetical protein